MLRIRVSYVRTIIWHENDSTFNGGGSGWRTPVQIRFSHIFPHNIFHLSLAATMIYWQILYWSLDKKHCARFAILLYYYTHTHFTYIGVTMSTGVSRAVSRTELSSWSWPRVLVPGTTSSPGGRAGHAGARTEPSPAGHTSHIYHLYYRYNITAFTGTNIKNFGLIRSSNPQHVVF